MSPNGIKLVQPKGRELKGGDLLAQSLKALGVEVAFGIHGGHLDAFLMGAVDAGIRLVDSRHETCSVNAAEGYSKVSGKIGVCFITANSGFGNGLPGIATAFADRNPVFVITSSPPLRDAETNSLQGFVDQVVLAKSITKFAHRVTVVEEIPSLVAFGFRAALGGAPGPVVIDFPIDILFSPVREVGIAWGALNAPIPLLPGPNRDAVKQTLELLKTAKRPVIITGSGGHSNKKYADTLTKFVETTQIPVFHALKYGPTIPLDHPLQAGITGRLGALGPLGLERPDLIILSGVRTGAHLGSRSGGLFPDDAKYIQIDVDGTEIGRSQFIDLGVVSDSGEYFGALLDAKVGVSTTPDWVKTITTLGDKLTSTFEQESVDILKGIHPYHAHKELFKSLPPGSIILMDGGETGSWSLQLIAHAKAHSHMLVTGHLGHLGNGFGYAIGAAVAEPDRLIVNIQGDGSAGFHLQELDTYARHKLNILTVVANNYVWGMSIHGQELLYGASNPARPVSTLSPELAFEIAARGFGVASKKVGKFSEIKPAVEELVSKGPSLLNLLISADPTHPGTTALVAPSDDPDIIVIPYYANVPRPYYK